MTQTRMEKCKPDPRSLRCLQAALKAPCADLLVHQILDGKRDQGRGQGQGRVSRQPGSRGTLNTAHYRQQRPLLHHWSRGKVQLQFHMILIEVCRKRSIHVTLLVFFSF